MAKRYKLTDLDSAIEIVDEIGKLVLGHDLTCTSCNGKDIYSFGLFKEADLVRYASNQIMINVKGDVIGIPANSVIVIESNTTISIASDGFDKCIKIIK